MIIIVCLDNKDGMFFNGRRQSRDQAILPKILDIAKQSKLWMNAYTSRLFDGNAAGIYVDEHFMGRAQSGEYCFVENLDLSAFFDKIESVYVFRWNRQYPSDVKFPMELVPALWSKAIIDEFSGKSHERITLEVYSP